MQLGDPQTGGGNAVALDVDRLTAGSHSLGRRGREPGEYERRQRLAPEAVSEEQRFGDAARTAREEL
jgi:hypothetical protein